jgi:hypothetical protein
MFDPQRKMYKKNSRIVGQHDVIGVSGDIALYQGKPVVHTHMVVGNSDGPATDESHMLAELHRDYTGLRTLEIEDVILFSGDGVAPSLNRPKAIITRQGGSRAHI